MPVTIAKNWGELGKREEKPGGEEMPFTNDGHTWPDIETGSHVEPTTRPVLAYGSTGRTKKCERGDSIRESLFGQGKKGKGPEKKDRMQGKGSEKKDRMQGKGSEKKDRMQGKQGSKRQNGKGKPKALGDRERIQSLKGANKEGKEGKGWRMVNRRKNSYRRNLQSQKSKSVEGKALVTSNRFELLAEEGFVEQNRTLRPKKKVKVKIGESVRGREKRGGGNLRQPVKGKKKEAIKRRENMEKKRSEKAFYDHQQVLLGKLEVVKDPVSKRRMTANLGK